MTPAHPSPADPATLAAVAAGGVVGSLGRWALGLALPHASGTFPWATFLVNVSGAFATGLLVAFLLGRPGARRLARPLLGVGVLGGWTTFSALAVDAVLLTSTGRGWLAVGYVAASFVLGVLAVLAGTSLVRRLRPGLRPAP
jgi:fluoride exporter